MKQREFDRLGRSVLRAFVVLNVAFWLLFRHATVFDTEPVDAFLISLSCFMFDSVERLVDLVRDRVRRVRESLPKRDGFVPFDLAAAMLAVALIASLGIPLADHVFPGPIGRSPRFDAAVTGLIHNVRTRAAIDRLELTWGGA